MLNSEAEVCWGLAKVPYSRRVNDPEKWRAHAWVRYGRSYFDPTYEIAWADTGQRFADIRYMLDAGVTVQPADSDIRFLHGIAEVERAAENYGIPLCTMGHEYTGNVSGRIYSRSPLSPRYRRFRETHWFDIRSLLASIDWLDCRYVYLSFHDDVVSDIRDFVLLGSPPGFVLQENTESNDTPKVLLVSELVPKQSALIWFAGRERQVAARHILTSDEVLGALEKVFRRIPCGSWEEVEGGYL